jgi:Glycosyl hydrolase 108
MPSYPEAFQKAIDFTLPSEGGYSNDPNDPGGETNFGISKRAHPTLDIKSLTREQAIAIYYNDYWLAAGCGAFPLALSVAYFDTAVNLGLTHTRAIAHTYRAVAEGVPDLERTSLLLNGRQDYYNHLVALHPTLAKYSHGWANRVKRLRDYCEGLYINA